MPSTNQATSQGGGAASIGSLEHSSTMTGPSRSNEGEHFGTTQANPALSTHREDSEIDAYPGDSPKYEEDDEDEGFHTAAGFETDRASQVSGHGGAFG